MKIENNKITKGFSEDVSLDQLNSAINRKADLDSVKIIGQTDVGLFSKAKNLTKNLTKPNPIPDKTYPRSIDVSIPKSTKDAYNLTRLKNYSKDENGDVRSIGTRIMDSINSIKSGASTVKSFFGKLPDKTDSVLGGAYDFADKTLGVGSSFIAEGLKGGGETFDKASEQYKKTGTFPEAKLSERSSGDLEIAKKSFLSSAVPFSTEIFGEKYLATNPKNFEEKLVSAVSSTTGFLVGSKGVGTIFKLLGKISVIGKIYNTTHKFIGKTESLKAIKYIENTYPKVYEFVFGNKGASSYVNDSLKLFTEIATLNQSQMSFDSTINDRIKRASSDFVMAGLLHRMGIIERPIIKIPTHGVFGFVSTMLDKGDTEDAIIQTGIWTALGAMGGFKDTQNKLFNEENLKNYINKKSIDVLRDNNIIDKNIIDEIQIKEQPKETQPKGITPLLENKPEIKLENKELNINDLSRETLLDYSLKNGENSSSIISTLKTSADVGGKDRLVKQVNEFVSDGKLDKQTAEEFLLWIDKNIPTIKTDVENNYKEQRDLTNTIDAYDTSKLNKIDEFFLNKSKDKLSNNSNLLKEATTIEQNKNYELEKTSKEKELWKINNPEEARLEEVTSKFKEFSEDSIRRASDKVVEEFNIKDKDNQEELESWYDENGESYLTKYSNETFKELSGGATYQESLDTITNLRKEISDKRNSPTEEEKKDTTLIRYSDNIKLIEEKVRVNTKDRISKLDSSIAVDKISKTEDVSVLDILNANESTTLFDIETRLIRGGYSQQQIGFEEFSDMSNKGTRTTTDIGTPKLQEQTMTELVKEDLSNTIDSYIDDYIRKSLGDKYFSVDELELTARAGVKEKTLLKTLYSFYKGFSNSVGTEKSSKDLKTIDKAMEMIGKSDKLRNNSVSVVYREIKSKIVDNIYNLMESENNEVLSRIKLSPSLDVSKMEKIINNISESGDVSDFGISESIYRAYKPDYEPKKRQSHIVKREADKLIKEFGFSDSKQFKDFLSTIYSDEFNTANKLEMAKDLVINKIDEGIKYKLQDKVEQSSYKEERKIYEDNRKKIKKGDYLDDIDSDPKIEGETAKRLMEKGDIASEIIQKLGVDMYRVGMKEGLSGLESGEKNSEIVYLSSSDKNQLDTIVHEGIGHVVDSQLGLVDAIKDGSSSGDLTFKKIEQEIKDYMSELDVADEYKKSQYITEGVARILTDYITGKETNPKTHLAQNFIEQYIKENSGIWDLIESTKETYALRMSQNPLDMLAYDIFSRKESSISENVLTANKTGKSSAREAFTNYVREKIGTHLDLTLYGREIDKTSGIDIKKTPRSSVENIMAMAEANKSGLFDVMFYSNGIPENVDKFFDYKRKELKYSTRPSKEIWSDVPKEHYKSFMAYLDFKQFKVLMDLRDSNPEYKDVVIPVEYDNPIKVNEAIVTMEERFPQASQLAEEIANYNEKLRDLRRQLDPSIATRESAYMKEKRYTGLSRQGGIFKDDFVFNKHWLDTMGKELVGSERTDFMDAMTIQLLETSSVAIQVTRQDAFNRIGYSVLGKNSKLASIVPDGVKIDPYSLPNDVVPIDILGKRRYLKLDIRVRDAIDSSTKKSGEIESLTRLAESYSQLKGLMATTLNPNFLLKNFVSDGFTANVRSEILFIPFVDNTKGMISYFKKDDYYKIARMYGLDSINFEQKDPNKLMQGLFGVNKDGSIMKGRFSNLKMRGADMINTLLEFGNASEMSTRIGILRKHKNINDPDSLLRALRDAQESTYRWRTRGLSSSVITNLNRIKRFFKPSIIVPYADFRTAKNNPMRTFKRISPYIVLSTVQAMANIDNDEYWQQPLWKRNLGINVPLKYLGINSEKVITIPILRNPITVLAWETPQLIIGMLRNKERGMAKDWAMSLAQNVFGFTPNTIDGPESFMQMVLPDIFSTSMELFANKSILTGKPIVPDYLKRRSKTEQIKPDTTEFAINLSGVIKKTTGVETSPIMIDTYLKGIFFSTYDLVNGFINYGTQKLGVDKNLTRNELKFINIPIIKSFISGNYDPSTAYSVSRFIDTYTDLKKYNDTYNEYANSGPTLLKSMQYRQANKENIIKYQMITPIYKAIQSQIAYYRVINRNREINDDDKQKELEEIRQRILSMTNTADTQLDMIFKK